MNDHVVSIIRTVVPVLVGSALSWLAQQGIAGLDSATITTAVTALTISLYYAAVRAAERRWARAGWLLGSPKAPTYTHDA